MPDDECAVIVAGLAIGIHQRVIETVYLVKNGKAPDTYPVWYGIPIPQNIVRYMVDANDTTHSPTMRPTPHFQDLKI